MKSLSAFACTIMFFSFGTTFSQNKLDHSKQELNENSGSKSQSSNSSSSSDSGGGGDDCGIAEGIAEGVAEVFVYATWGVAKYGVIGDYNNERHLNNVLSPYPYYNNHVGNFDAQDTITGARARFDLEDSFVYSNSSLYGNHIKAKIRPFQYFYLQTDYHQLFEFNRFEHTSDKLALFQFNICYDRIRFEKFNFGWNLGATYIGNEVRKGGFAYGLNAEYFMGNHISFLASGKWSKVNTHPVNAFELQAKYHRKNYFVSLGFEHLKIATPNYNFIALGGGIYF